MPWASRSTVLGAGLAAMTSPLPRGPSAWAFSRVVDAAADSPEPEQSPEISTRLSTVVAVKPSVRRVPIRSRSTSWTVASADAWSAFGT